MFIYRYSSIHPSIPRFIHPSIHLFILSSSLYSSTLFVGCNTVWSCRGYWIFGLGLSRGSKSVCSNSNVNIYWYVTSIRLFIHSSIHPSIFQNLTAFAKINCLHNLQSNECSLIIGCQVRIGSQNMWSAIYAYQKHCQALFSLSPLHNYKSLHMEWSNYNIIIYKFIMLDYIHMHTL